MPLRDTLQTILTDYAKAKGQPFAGHGLAGFVRHSAAEAVRDALGELGSGLMVEGSAGAGNWAAVPWISVFDPAITTTATQGYMWSICSTPTSQSCFCPSTRALPQYVKNLGHGRVKFCKTERT